VAGGDHGLRGALAGRGLDVVAAALLGEPPLGERVARRGVLRVLPQGDGDDGDGPGHGHDPQHDAGDEHPGTTPRSTDAVQAAGRRRRAVRRRPGDVGRTGFRRPAATTPARCPPAVFVALGLATLGEAG
jgi:hypothetical protein